MRIVGTAFVAAVIGLGLASCGSSATPATSSATGPSASTPSTSSSQQVASFIASADAICKAGNEALVPLKGLGASGSVAAAQQALQNAEGAFTVAANQLAALKPPAPVAAGWATYVSDLRSVQTDVSGMTDAVGAGDGAALQRDAQEAKSAVSQAKHAIAGFHFKHCGTGH